MLLPSACSTSSARRAGNCRKTASMGLSTGLHRLSQHYRTSSSSVWILSDIYACYSFTWYVRVTTRPVVLRQCQDLMRAMGRTQLPRARTHTPGLGPGQGWGGEIKEGGRVLLTEMLVPRIAHLSSMRVSKRIIPPPGHCRGRKQGHLVLQTQISPLPA